MPALERHDVQGGYEHIDIACELLFWVCSSEFGDFGEGEEDLDGGVLDGFDVKFW